jgi:hypothetical protein
MVKPGKPGMFKECENIGLILNAATFMFSC